MHTLIDYALNIDYSSIAYLVKIAAGKDTLGRISVEKFMHQDAGTIVPRFSRVVTDSV